MTRKKTWKNFPKALPLFANIYSPCKSMKLFFIIITFLLSPLWSQVEVSKLPKDLAKKTASLNPEFLIFGKGQATKNKKIPLLIYLHGGGGVGDEIRKVERQPRRLLETIKKAGHKCLCVVPQAIKSARDQKKRGGWIPADLDLLLEHLKKILPVDENRIYLTGNSMGGYGTFVWAASSPDHFAAIAPMVGGLGSGGPRDVTPKLDEWGKNLAKIPMKAYYGKKDRVVPADRGEMVMKAIKKAGGTKAQLIILPEEGHGAGRVPASDPKFANWMFSQQKK
jgi:predicted peptidase